MTSVLCVVDWISKQLPPGLVKAVGVHGAQEWSFAGMAVQGRSEQCTTPVGPKCATDLAATRGR